MTFTLRDYSAADFDRLYEIDQACYERGIAYSRRMLRWYLGQRGSFCMVAEAHSGPDPEVLGFIIAHARGASTSGRAKSAQAEDPGGEGYIITIDVLESHRRSGIGTALLEETERRLARMGVRYVGLQTATNNEAGVAFWQRHGYRSCGVARGYYLGRIDAYEMFKELRQTERPATA